MTEFRHHPSHHDGNSCWSHLIQVSAYAFWCDNDIFKVMSMSIIWLPFGYGWNKVDLLVYIELSDTFTVSLPAAVSFAADWESESESESQSEPKGTERRKEEILYPLYINYIRLIGNQLSIIVIYS